MRSFCVVVAVGVLAGSAVVSSGPAAADSVISEPDSIPATLPVVAPVDAAGLLVASAESVEDMVLNNEQASVFMTPDSEAARAAVGFHASLTGLTVTEVGDALALSGDRDVLAGAAGVLDRSSHVRDVEVLPPAQPLGVVLPPFEQDEFWGGTNVERVYEQMGLEAAWEITGGHTTVDGFVDDGPVRIAILDQGVWNEAPFGDRLLPGYDAVLDMPTADAEAQGLYDYAKLGHGDPVAVAAAGAPSDEWMGFGACYECEVLPVQVFGQRDPDTGGLTFEGGATWSNISRGMDYAIANGADVINLSLGLNSLSTSYIDGIMAEAEEAGVVVVAAAGNWATPHSGRPASSPTVISVGSTLADYQRASYSNFSPLTVDVTAPSMITLAKFDAATGAYIEDTAFSGTSNASPMAAGVVALIIDRFPEYSPAEVRERLFAFGLDTPETRLNPEDRSDKPPVASNSHVWQDSWKMPADGDVAPSAHGNVYAGTGLLDRSIPTPALTPVAVEHPFSVEQTLAFTRWGHSCAANVADDNVILDPALFPATSDHKTRRQNEAPFPVVAGTFRPTTDGTMTVSVNGVEVSHVDVSTTGSSQPLHIGFDTNAGPRHYLQHGDIVEWTYVSAAHPDAPIVFTSECVLPDVHAAEWPPLTAAELTAATTVSDITAECVEGDQDPVFTRTTTFVNPIGQQLLLTLRNTSGWDYDNETPTYVEFTTAVAGGETAHIDVPLDTYYYHHSIYWQPTVTYHPDTSPPEVVDFYSVKPDVSGEWREPQDHSGLSGFFCDTGDGSDSGSDGSDPDGSDDSGGDGSTPDNGSDSDDPNIDDNPVIDDPGVDDNPVIGDPEVDDPDIGDREPDNDSDTDRDDTPDSGEAARGRVPLNSLAGARLLDSRGPGTTDGDYAGTGRHQPHDVLYVQIAGRGGVPADATAATLSVVGVGATGWGHVTVWPCASDTDPVPNSSVLNLAPGWTRANSLTTSLGATGGVCVYASTGLDLVVDVQSYSRGDGLTAISPVRILDSRDPSHGGFAFNETRRYVVSDQIPAATGASAVFANITTVGATADGFITVWPCASVNDPMPNSSIVNFVPGEAVANNAVIGLVDDGFCVFSYQPAHIIIDISGYLSPDAAIDAITPDRYLDTREMAAWHPSSTGSVGIGRYMASETRAFDLAAVYGNDVTAVIANITVVSPAGDNHLTAWPCESATDTVPNTSMLNYNRAWSATPNTSVQTLSDSGLLCVYSYAAADLIIDVNALVRG